MNLSDSNSAGVFADYGLTYDGGNNTVGNLTDIVEADGSSVGYGYDGLYRSKPIEEVREAEWVVSRHEQSGQVEYKRIVQTTVRSVGSVLSVGLADRKSGKVVETLTTTNEHPFLVEGKGFVPAGQLARGNATVPHAGPSLVVQSVTVHTRKEGYTVYNFVVEDDHTYFVGTHNGTLGVWFYGGHRSGGGHLYRLLR